MSPRGPSVYSCGGKGGQRAGSTGAFGDRINRQTAPGDRRHPTLFATWIVWDPATATPISPTTTWIPQITARMRSACPLDGEVSQIVTLRDRQPGCDHEADAESDAKRAGSRVLDRFHGQPAYCIGLRPPG